MQMIPLESRQRLVLLRARGLTVSVIWDAIECIVARIEYVTQSDLWSFLGCAREHRVPVVRINAWTTHGGPFTTTIEVENEQEASDVLESLLSQIPEALNGDAEDETPEPAPDVPHETDQQEQDESDGEEEDNEDEQSDKEESDTERR